MRKSLVNCDYPSLPQLTFNKRLNVFILLRTFCPSPWRSDIRLHSHRWERPLSSCVLTTDRLRVNSRRKFCQHWFCWLRRESLLLITHCLESVYDVSKSNRLDRVDVSPCISCSLNGTGSFFRPYFLTSSWSSFVIGVALFEAFFLNA